MALRDLPPFRGDHVGSLLRPPELLKAREEHAAGNLTDEQLAEVEDRCIVDVIAMQREVGLCSATDGEFRRTSWHMDFIYQLGGVGRASDELKVEFRNESGTFEFTSAALRIDAPVRLERPIFADHFDFLKAHAGDATPKLTIPSPSMVHYRGGAAAIDRAVYPELDQFWKDLAAAYAAEVAALAERGCTYLQLDDTSLAYLNDPRQRALVSAQGFDGEHQHLRNIELVNAALADRPSGMTVTTHLCRGNFRSSWAAEGGYDFVAEPLFGQLEVDGFFLEYDDARSGGFAPLRFVPKGKVVVLGLVSTKRGALESRDDLKRRVEEASRYIDIDQLCLSPQCGFSSTVDGNALSYDEEVAKLQLVVETASEIWG